MCAPNTEFNYVHLFRVRVNVSVWWRRRLVYHKYILCRLWLSLYVTHNTHFFAFFYKCMFDLVTAPMLMSNVYAWTECVKRLNIRSKSNRSVGAPQRTHKCVYYNKSKCQTIFMISFIYFSALRLLSTVWLLTIVVVDGQG